MQILFQECLYYNSFERIRKYHHYYLSTVSSPEVNASSTCIYFLSLLGSIDSGAFSLHSFLGRKVAFTSGQLRHPSFCSAESLSYPLPNESTR